jgi:hypothetical protein
MSDIFEFERYGGDSGGGEGGIDAVGGDRDTLFIFSMRDTNQGFDAREWKAHREG